MFSTWLYFAVPAVVAFLFMVDHIAVARNGGYFLNAPFVVAVVTVIGYLVWLLVAAYVAGDAAARDVETRMHPVTW